MINNPKDCNSQKRLHDKCQELKRLLADMPENVRSTFDAAQLEHLSQGLIKQRNSNHFLDLRPTLKIPLVPWSFYIVLLMGKNRREMSAREKRVAARTLIISLLLGIILLSLAGLIVLYLLKSAMGINIFKNFSLGLWTWFMNFLE
ncbi:hypothetical protein [Sessilibacter sp. MAH2]